eukprot:468345_1
MFIVRFVNTLINVSLGYFIEQYIVLMIIDYLGKKTYASFNSIWKSNASSNHLVSQIWNKSDRFTSFEHESDDQHIYSVEPNSLQMSLIGQNKSDDQHIYSVELKLIANVDWSKRIVCIFLVYAHSHKDRKLV